MEDKLIKLAEEAIDRQLEQGLTTNNLDTIKKLVDIYKDTKEAKNMYGEYGEYRAGRGGNYGNYDEYNEYGARRGRRRRYRGDDYMDRMAEEYGRYNESRQRYGANDPEVDKSFHYMVKALEDFVMVLKEEAESPQQKQQLMTALQNSMR